MVNATTKTSSAGGIISLLDEKNEEIQVFALGELEKGVGLFWPEISHIVGKIELLYESEKFSQKKLAALLLSKVYYYLGEFNAAVEYALGAEDLFDLNKSQSSQYIDTIIGKCIDKYIEVRGKGESVDMRLQQVVERMFKRCFDDGEFKQAIGIALESRRLDVIEQTIAKAAGNGARKELLNYLMDVSMQLVENLEFRNMVLKLLVNLFKNDADEADYLSISQCLVWLNDVQTMADTLSALALSSKEFHVLTAYQIAFDINQMAQQEFLLKVNALIKQHKAAAENVHFQKLSLILAGDETIKFHLEFLFRNNKSDSLILTSLMNGLDSRNTGLHSGLTFAHAFMNAGTTSDKFLRDNMDWLSRANNWTKFTATAQLGVVHKGNLANSKSLLSPYLPQDGTSVNSSVYVEGGALYAMGLIHANHGKDVLPFLVEKLRSQQDQVVLHGAALGIGAAGMATHDQSLYEALKAVLFTDSAVAGEASALAMGLVMVASGNRLAVDELLQYARETQHEKIIRGISLAIALILFGREEAADDVIHQLLADKDPLLRYSGVYTIALAYVGTSANKAIEQLLHLAVSDANDDVRRAAVTALGFVLVKNAAQVPRTVQLLSDSFNPSVRYGSAMALGIACAGSAGTPMAAEAMAIIEQLTKDSNDYVRQGAFIASSMIFMQSNETNSKAVEYRKMYEKIATNKHEDLLARFGAILATGIVDAGGRNCTISLTAAGGNIDMESVVGMAVFLQFWQWFPLAHFLSLSFTPTCLIGLDKDLKMPQFEVLSAAKPSQFAYPQPRQPKTDEKVEKVATAVLSTTAKAKARAKKAEKDKNPDAMDTDVTSPKSPMASTTITASGTEEAKAAADKKEEVATVIKKEEPASEMLKNLSRVVIPQQVKVLQWPTTAKYQPIKSQLSGILMLKDTKPETPAEFLEFSTPTISTAADDAKDKEADPPEPFEYVE